MRLENSSCRPALVDAHAHLHEEAFDADRDAVIKCAQAVGVETLICCGTSEADWARLHRIADEHPGLILPQYGLHPWFVSERSNEWEKRLASFLDGPNVGLGEIGLDKIRKKRSPMEDQIRVFQRQWRLACERSLPINVHCVQAFGLLEEQLRMLPTPRRGFILHGFGASPDCIQRLAEMGAYFSIGSAVVDPRNDRVRTAARRIPENRLLIETDSPHMPPREPYTPKSFKQADGSVRNEPCFLADVLSEVATLRETPVEELSVQLRKNAATALL